jgi:hypothetical protein
MQKRGTREFYAAAGRAAKPKSFIPEIHVDSVSKKIILCLYHRLTLPWQAHYKALQKSGKKLVGKGWMGIMDIRTELALIP